MGKIKLKLKKRTNESYIIYCEPNIVNSIPKYLHKHKFGKRYCVITDNKIQKIHGNNLQKLLKQNTLAAEIISVAPGEDAKSLENIKKICEKLIKLEFNRNDCIIALGGGVIGDLAGFVAAIFMRGLPYIQIPTSLLAMVDSSVGGKTAINLGKLKNILGAFKQPKAVFIDSLFLDTMPKAEIQNGLAECIKYGASLDKRFFKYLEKNIPLIYKPEKNSEYNYNQKILNKIIEISIRLKSKIIQKDDKETGLRRVLNYGHTYGHAIEAASKHKISHGHAISIGMCLINEKLVRDKILKNKDAQRIKQLLDNTGLPTSLPQNIKKNDLLALMKNDKKNKKKGQIDFVKIKKIGDFILE